MISGPQVVRIRGPLFSPSTTRKPLFELMFKNGGGMEVEVEHRRRRMAKAMRRWHMWADSTQDYRAITTRRFHVWLFQTRRVLRKRLVFTRCFWPFTSTSSDTG